MYSIRTTTILSILLALCIGVGATAQDYNLDWHTIDGGGGTSTGGGFRIDGTIGQHDAGAMTGGSFAVTGGFWHSFVPSCSCLGDMNGDGARNGADIHQFVACVISGGSCVCADIDGMNGVSIDDVPAFVSDLLAGAGCP